MRGKFSFYLMIFSLILSYQSIRKVYAQDDLERLQEGNDRFVSGHALHPNQGAERLKETNEKQRPFAAVLTCSDSRLSPEIIFDQGIGDLFVVRIAGNTIDDQVIGSLEFAVSNLGVKTLVVLGHEECGAVDAALSGEPMEGHITSLEKPIREAISGCPRHNGLPCAIHANVEFVSNKLKNSTPILAKSVEAGQLKIIPAIYHLKSGKIDWLN